MEITLNQLVSNIFKCLFLILAFSALIIYSITILYGIFGLGFWLSFIFSILINSLLILLIFLLNKYGDKVIWHKN